MDEEGGQAMEEEPQEENSPGDNEVLWGTPQVAPRWSKLDVVPPPAKKRKANARVSTFEKAKRAEFDVWSKNVVYFAPDLDNDATQVWDQVVSSVPDSQAPLKKIDWWHKKSEEQICEGKQQLKGLDFHHWNQLLDMVIERYVTQEAPCAPPVPPRSVEWEVKKVKTKETYNWPATYAPAQERGVALWLPIEGLRRECEVKKNGSFRILLWVYGCRKIRVPKCMGTPHPHVPWHKDLYLWVGPDGYPVRKVWEEKVVNWRANLLGRQQSTSKRSRALGENWPEFSHVEGDPEPVTVD